MPERDGFMQHANVEESYTDYDSTPQASTGNPSSQQFDIYHVRRVVAGNPNTPKQVLSRLASDQIPGIRRRVAENPRTPLDVLTQLAQDRDSDVRLAVAENANTPPEILGMLSEDDDVDVRYGVAENPHMPEDILFKLSEDDNPYIRCRALKTLQMMAPDVQSRLQLMMQPGYGGQSYGQHG